ncbi:dephospho-CoA kinase [Flavobacterium arsenatis]|uniref:Dephospho-CoA kinase n=1 Tax=Flavobacterium arsenatis TaxID=1484332 RepID=A0ABU1TQP6_9FLAO|nr:dephospho-CoA kinase [Flavobacterium arsenatis]MDR6968216.1 dephospho-CoA kinase [Flavobacterium arsenatis]
MTKIIGLTGGIGSGKTTVAKQFEALGVPVYIADSEAKKIMDLPDTIQLIRNEFGNSIFEDDILNREKLAKIVFENPEKLQKLNGIIHPLVKNHFLQWFQKNKNADFVIRETAILFESGSYKDCDKIISVVAPLETRIERVVKRDDSDYESVMKRVQNQWTDEMRTAKSDYIIENINLENTINQVNILYKELKDM